MALQDNDAQALVYERNNYLRAGRADRAAQVDAVLASHGLQVNDVGELVELEKPTRPARERAVAQRAPETAVAD